MSVEDLRQMYPEQFREPGFIDIVYILIALLPFLIMYLYIRFIENNLISYINFRLIPFIRYKMRLNGIINFVHRILNIKIFGFDNQK